MPTLPKRDLPARGTTREPENSHTAHLYRCVEPLSPQKHKDLLLKQAPDFHFARDAIAVPIMDTEFATIARFYPILFDARHYVPLAVLGPGENRFVDMGGRWKAGTYIPAYLRRYPFLFVQDHGVAKLALDRASERLTTDAAKAEPLFYNGKVGHVVKVAMALAARFQSQHQAAMVFAAALAGAKLLVPWRDVLSPHGASPFAERHLMVDPARFLNLGSDTVTAWHRLGWLGMVHFHFASMGRLHDHALQ